MWWLPEVGEMFLITNNAQDGEEGKSVSFGKKTLKTIIFQLNTEGFFRCVRLPLDSTNEMTVQMIDLGEIHTIPFNELPFNNMLVCPDNLKKTPPLAIKCRRNDIFDEIDELLDPISQLLYRKQTFEVIGVEEDLIVVDIHPFDNNHGWDEEQAAEELKHIDENEIKMTMKEPEPAKDSMTTKEKEIWDEEPLNTNNPQVALQGFQTRDDNRLCKFYDPEIGGCWKGGRCKLRHVAELKDGTLRDTEESYSDNIEKTLPLPNLHSQIQLRATEMIANNRFWCVYEGLKKTKGGCDKEMLTNFLNMEEEVETYKELKSIPGITQLVLYKSGDGKFHRARVESFPDENYWYHVLLVDEGITIKVNYQKLYHWNPRAEFLPFQAVAIEIANIKLDHAADKSKIMPHLLNADGKPLKGIVLDVFTEIKCILLDSKGNDIGEKLVELGLAEKKKPLAPTTIDFGLPG